MKQHVEGNWLRMSPKDNGNIAPKYAKLNSYLSTATLISVHEQIFDLEVNISSGNGRTGFKYAKTDIKFHSGMLFVCFLFCSTESYIFSARNRVQNRLREEKQNLFWIRIQI